MTSKPALAAARRRRRRTRSAGSATTTAGRDTGDSSGLWVGQLAASGSCAATSRPSAVSAVIRASNPGSAAIASRQADARIVVDGEDEFAVGPGGDRDAPTPLDAPEASLEGRDARDADQPEDDDAGRPTCRSRALGRGLAAGASLAAASLAGASPADRSRRAHRSSVAGPADGGSLVLAEVAGEGRGLGFGGRKVGARLAGLGDPALIGRWLGLGAGGFGDLGDRGIRQRPARRIERRRRRLGDRGGDTGADRADPAWSRPWSRCGSGPARP